MLLVVANRSDEAAAQFVNSRAAHDVALLTCEDLSVGGWRYWLNHPEGSWAVIRGRQVALAEITGVLTRLPCVFEQELTHILPADRAYIAAEMTAFLLAWLSSLRCPVLNRPTAACLAGPNWRPEQWTHAAAQIGIPVLPVRRRMAFVTATPASGEDQPEGVVVTIVGQRQWGQVDQALVAQARQLADIAGVDLLSARFSSPEPGAAFLGASLWPNMANDEVADAILAYFEQSHVS